MLDISTRADNKNHMLCVIIDIAAVSYKMVTYWIFGFYCHTNKMEIKVN